MSDHSTETIEIWEDVPGYENLYQVSNLGQIRSLSKHTLNRWGGETFRKGRIMCQVKSRKGYLMIHLSRSNKARSLSVARIVATVFIPNPDDKPQVNHKDTVKTNNKASNLEWVTQTENMDHAKANGLIRHQKGEQNPFSRLTKFKVLEIVSLHESGKFTSYEIAPMFGVCQSAVGHILSGRNWSSVTGRKLKQADK